MIKFSEKVICSVNGNGNPTPVFLPGDGGAWQAAVYGVSQSWRRLKGLNSSSSSSSVNGDIEVRISYNWSIFLSSEAL